MGDKTAVDTEIFFEESAFPLSTKLDLSSKMAAIFVFIIVGLYHLY